MSKIIPLLLLLTALLLATEKRITITLTEGKEYHHSFRSMGLFPIKTTPQIVFWLEDKEGNFIKTLYISQKSGTSSFVGATKKSRPSSLPIWAHKRGEKNSYGTYMPTAKEPTADAITAASPKAGFSKTFLVPTDKELFLCAEINNSMDFNETFSKKEKKESPYYSNNVGGQPSLLYKILLPPTMSEEETLELVGHGEPAGRDGKIYPILDNITTAKDIISSIVVTKGE